MNFEYYNVKGGIATPENPTPRKSVTFNYEFERFANTNTLPCINVPDGRYHKDELQEVWQMRMNKYLVDAGIDQEYKWQTIGKPLDVSHEMFRRAITLVSPSPDRLVKLSEVVQKLEEFKNSGIEGSPQRIINRCINLIKAL